MVDSIGQIGSGINALAKEYHTVAHNIANVNTAGFKRRVNSFSREMMGMASGGGDESLSAAEISAEGAVDFSQGSLVNSGRSLDVAILGKGFFVVETPDGPLYTRNGVFQFNTQGQLVDLNNRIVAGVGGPIVVPSNVSELDINVAGDGNVTANGSVLGKLRVVDFKDQESQLESAGRSCFRVDPEIRPVTRHRATVTNIRLTTEPQNIKAKPPAHLPARRQPVNPVHLPERLTGKHRVIHVFSEL